MSPFARFANQAAPHNENGSDAARNTRDEDMSPSSSCHPLAQLSGQQESSAATGGHSPLRHAASSTLGRCSLRGASSQGTQDANASGTLTTVGVSHQLFEQAHCGENLMEMAVARGDTCIKVLVEALLDKRFSHASVLLHFKRALLALREKPRHHQLFLELLLQLPLLELKDVVLRQEMFDNAKHDWVE